MNPRIEAMKKVYYDPEFFALDMEAIFEKMLEAVDAVDRARRKRDSIHINRMLDSEEEHPGQSQYADCY